jgi:hypothetical protein
MHPQYELLHVLCAMVCQLICTVDPGGQLSYCDPAWKSVMRAGAPFA